jgi:hypothetical protein
MSWIEEAEKQKESRLSKLSKFPVNFVRNLREVPIGVMGTVRSIRRYRRRSISMISGLILGISILAGIFIYSTVLQNNVYIHLLNCITK